ncbi:thiol-disulfide oxidoreductase DCC family protein [Enterovibrio sp. 27052020O]|uniref:thiol-disulfide oxidoreductase DCC family protein n=1 Tax=Enterovibrio sp. 27052020O TaxID=3241166 RepID=UPI00388D4CA4
MKFTLFYDGSCPLCVAEMHQLRALNHRDTLAFEDILAPDFTHRYPDISPDKARNVLHGKYDDGRLLLGLDVTHHAWKLVGRKRWIGLLRLPVIRWFADKAYLFFAKNRYRISWLLTGKSRCAPCANGACDINTINNRNTPKS